MQSELNLDRLLSFWTHEVEYTLGGELEPGQLAALIDGCVNRLLPPAIFQDNAIQDLKGCGPQTLLVENAPAPEYPEELLFLSGQYLPPSDSPEQDGPNPEDVQPDKAAFQLRARKAAICAMATVATARSRSVDDRQNSARDEQLIPGQAQPLTPADRRLLEELGLPGVPVAVLETVEEAGSYPGSL